MNGRLTITNVAKTLGVTPRTIMRWEKAGKIRKSKRDWRGWRFYSKEDMEEIRTFLESAYEFNGFEKSAINTAKDLLIILISLTCLTYSYIIGSPAAYAVSPENFAKAATTPGIAETPSSIDIVLDDLPAVTAPEAGTKEAVKYTLGPNDVIAIEVRRHPEFSGEYRVNSEGKIEYKYIGDIVVSGFTKKELKDRLTEIFSEFIISPEVDVQIVAYLSKVFYVVGEVGRPGKFYMRGDTITVREALVQAGLPRTTAEMGTCRLITPDNYGKDNYEKVNVTKLLYEGDLRQNKIMHPGDVFYVPATFLVKVIRVISPVTDLVSQTAGSAAQGAAAAALAL